MLWVPEWGGEPRRLPQNRTALSEIVQKLDAWAQVGRWTLCRALRARHPWVALARVERAPLWVSFDPRRLT